MLTTLIVIVPLLCSHPHRRHEPAHPLRCQPAAGSLIEVREPRKGLAASSQFGVLELQLEPGTYTVSANRGPRTAPFATRTVRLGRHQVTLVL